MTREELIKQCRYYKGGADESQQSLIAGYEKDWVDALLEDKNAFKEHEKIYKKAGLTHFREDENPPLSYKSYLYTRFCYKCGCGYPEMDAEEFRNWYNRVYD